MKNKRKSKQDLLKRRLQQVATPLVAIVSGTIAGGISGIGGGGVLPGAAGGFLSTVLFDWATRSLSKIEVERVVSVVSIAAKRAERFIEVDMLPVRNDGFFGEQENRSKEPKSVEMLEGIITIAKNTYEQQKIKYIGNLYASMCFNEKIPLQQMSSFLNFANRLSYNQYCLLAGFMDKNSTFLFHIPQVKFEAGKTTAEQIVVLTELYDLIQLGFIVSSKPVNYFLNIDIASLKTQGIGVALWDSMGLNQIPYSQVRKVLSPLGVTYNEKLLEGRNPKSKPHEDDGLDITIEELIDSQIDIRQSIAVGTVEDFIE